jgi:hypothetical protein
VLPLVERAPPVRRDFTAGLGGIMLAFSLDPRAGAGQAPATLPGSLQQNRMLDAWLRINADGTATVFTARLNWGRASSPRWRRSQRRNSIFRSRG